MNRSEIENKLTSYKEAFSSFVRQNPERAFFLGILIGFFFFVLKGLLIPLMVAALGLSAVLWFLGDNSEAVEQGERSLHTELKAEPVNSSPEKPKASATYVPKKPRETRRANSTRKRTTAASGETSKKRTPKQAVKQSPTGAKTKKKAVSKPKSSKVAKPAAKKTASKKEGTSRAAAAKTASKKASAAKPKRKTASGSKSKKATGGASKRVTKSSRRSSAPSR